jgi:hypothetical protein
MTKLSAPFKERGIAIGAFQNRYDPGPQDFGVAKRIQRIAVPVCSRYAARNSPLYSLPSDVMCLLTSSLDVI